MTNLTTSEKENKKIYFREFWPPIIFYMVWVFIVPEILNITGQGWWTIPITLTQVIPLILVARAMIRFVDRCDELMRFVYMKSAVSTLVILTFVCISYGFLEFNGYPKVSLFMIGVFVIPIYFMSAFVIRKKLDGK